MKRKRIKSYECVAHNIHSCNGATKSVIVEANTEVKAIKKAKSIFDSEIGPLGYGWISAEIINMEG